MNHKNVLLKDQQNHVMLLFCPIMSRIKPNICTELSPSTQRRHTDAMTLTPCRFQLHRNRCHSLSPLLTSNTGSSQQRLDNWSSSCRSPQREKGKMDTTRQTFNLSEPTETEPGEGRDKTARRTVGDRDSTDEQGGVGKRGGGGWFVWPHSTRSEEKQAKTPALDKGCYGNPSPLGQEISGESTDRIFLQLVCENRKNVMSSLLFKASCDSPSHQVEVFFSPYGHMQRQYI